MEAVKVPDTLRHQESVYADHMRQTKEITPHYVICQYRVSYDVSSSFRVLCFPNTECIRIYINELFIRNPRLMEIPNKAYMIDMQLNSHWLLKLPCILYVIY